MGKVGRLELECIINLVVGSVVGRMQIFVRGPLTACLLVCLLATAAT